MKKFFALALAVAMIMSMASVSFAALAPSYVDLKAEGEAAIAAKRYDNDEKEMKSSPNYGETVYFPLYIDGELVSDYELVEKLKVKVSYEMGEELVKGVSVVKKYTEENGYAYYVAFETVKKTVTSDADVIGTLEFSRKEVKDWAEDALQGGKIDKDDNEVDFEFTLFWRNNYNKEVEGGNQLMVNANVDEVELEFDTDYVLKFKNDDEVDFTFGHTNNGFNEGTFTVDVSGQGKLYIRYNTTADEAIAAANPGVKMHFVNFNNVKFNRTGEFAYEMEDGVACYKVVDGALVAIPGAEYDDADETFYFNTRVLESYVFADAELVNPVVEAPVVEAPAVTNPTTGA